MNFAFWSAPAVAFIFCIARSSLGRAIAAQAWVSGSVVLAGFRFLFGHRPAGYPALRGG